jgi:hypothetical protein
MLGSLRKRQDLCAYLNAERGGGANVFHLGAKTRHYSQLRKVQIFYFLYYEPMRALAAFIVSLYTISKEFLKINFF